MKQTNKIDLSLTSIAEEEFFKISNSDELRPFFMTIVSDSNHWMFISSNGGLSAGRKNAQHALFPYYTDDKITESAELTGSKSIFRVNIDDKIHLWEPFSDRYDGVHQKSRNLYKNLYGNKVVFEEINHDLKLTFRYQWNSSNEFGFVKKSCLINDADHSVEITMVDGIQNIVPCGVNSDLQNSASNLVDAYKRSELEKETGLGIYALSAIIVDRAEPSEALKANIVWQHGLEKITHLLSSLQLKAFRRGESIVGETDVKAEKGAYFVHSTINLEAGTKKEWMFMADVNKNHSAVASISALIKDQKELSLKIHESIEIGTQRLVKLNAAVDGIQLTSDKLEDSRHFSNVLFNIMRGGIMDYNYQVEKSDFINYLHKATKEGLKHTSDLLKDIPDVFSLSELQELANKSEDSRFKRLSREYMPLKFSRRHGDPSRPWNIFSINTHSEIDGSKILDYQGNWRDIFQNWEALAYSFPEFMESMIQKFLNASTFDGYNPYRVTKDGFDWETIEADDPWSYIGYWGDHQIIYLLKFLEFLEKHQPGKLAAYFKQDIFVYANVPYKIKSYEDTLKNPKDTIIFDEELDHQIRKQKEITGADATLLHDQKKVVHEVNFIEKILATTLAKLSNFIPEGGIWMNTQRPEWNDANNALVGNGVSMVTLYYLRRFLLFFQKLLSSSNLDQVEISGELFEFFEAISASFNKHKTLLSACIDDKDRKLIMDSLGQAASNYRNRVYQKSFSGKKQALSSNALIDFISLALDFVNHTIKSNKREDNMYHAYNLMKVENEEEVSISYLDEMLEGQVAVLSSGYLSSKDALALLNGLKNSSLFRTDQYSYILYPNKNLPLFTEKNNIPKTVVTKSSLLGQLIDDGNIQIIEKDIDGQFHFNGDFKNANDLENGLTHLMQRDYSQFAEADKELVLQIFEEVFNHRAFTGRSGTFFGYEGLGSIYWHMVSKLRLAVQECFFKAVKEKESAEVIGGLMAHYYEIKAGIGVHKSPKLYGAFPTDAYSHTPAGKGAQQPGMTGQVKEDVLCRFGELGVFVEDGKLYFDPSLLRKSEFLLSENTFNYVDTNSKNKQILLHEGSLCFTYCQIPIVYKIADENMVEIVYSDNSKVKNNSLVLEVATSQQIFKRTGDIIQINVELKEALLK